MISLTSSSLMQLTKKHPPKESQSLLNVKSTPIIEKSKLNKSSSSKTLNYNKIKNMSKYSPMYSIDKEIKYCQNSKITNKCDKQSIKN